MFIYIKKLLVGIFAHPSYHSRLDDFITARRPQDVYDVERLIQEFDRHLTKGVI